MKYLPQAILLASLTAIPLNAAYISAFTTSEGVVGGATGDANVTGSATLTSITVGGTTYTNLTGAEGIFGANTAERLWANTLSDPATSTAAVSDLNLATGTLNTNASYDISGAATDDLIFVFGNGNGSIGTGSGGQTPPGNMNFFATDGTTLVGTLSDDVFFQDPGTNSVRAPNLASFDFTRSSNGNALNSRTVSGFAFALSDVALEIGASIDDIAIVNFNSSGSDYQDIGYAAVPEPGTFALLAGCFGLGVAMLRRRK